MATATREDTRLHLQESRREDSKLPKVVGISVPFPGARRPLEEGQKLGMWDFVLLEENIAELPKADIYILAAWHPVYASLVGEIHKLGAKVGVLWTSSVGEMDFEPIEQEYLGQLLVDPKINFIWFGDPALGRLYPHKGFYAPYPFDVDSIKVDPHDVDKDNIATLFCPTGPKKNILNQLHAMRLVQKERKLTLHTNVRGYNLEGLDCVVHDWLPQVDYYKLLTSAKVNLACSWSETFNYNVAEAALLGTISVTSYMVPPPGLKVKNPNNLIHIAEKIIEVVDDPMKYLGMKEFLQIRNYECRRILLEQLQP